jgi:hypothetical protein
LTGSRMAEMHSFRYPYKYSCDVRVWHPETLALERNCGHCGNVCGCRWSSMEEEKEGWGEVSGPRKLAVGAPGIGLHMLKRGLRCGHSLSGRTACLCDNAARTILGVGSEVWCGLTDGGLSVWTHLGMEGTQRDVDDDGGGEQEEDEDEPENEDKDDEDDKAAEWWSSDEG